MKHFHTSDQRKSLVYIYNKQAMYTSPGSPTYILYTYDVCTQSYSMVSVKSLYEYICTYVIH